MTAGPGGWTPTGGTGPVRRGTAATEGTTRRRTPGSGGKVKAALRLAQDIVATMYDRRMRPGDRYLSEADALQRHQVARGTYREALRFLEIQGVVDVRAGPGGGPEIRRPGWGQLASTIALLLQFSDTPLREVLEARTALEPGVARAVAMAATDDDVAAMAADLDAVEAGIGDYRTFAAAYLSYWDHFAAGTHNGFLRVLSPALRAIVNSAGFIPNEPYRVAVLGRLRTVHAAVARHDPDAAAAAMTELELDFYDRLTTGYPGQVDRVVAWSHLDLDP
ncbi:MAG TPA: FCD domain-containing protein [Acidimicrobiales bacterium]|nr:FCD domain-containing protein [Acidimicrobiales bacterium]